MPFDTAFSTFRSRDGGGFIQGVLGRLARAGVTTLRSVTTLALLAGIGFQFLPDTPRVEKSQARASLNSSSLVQSLAFHPSAKILASVGKDGMLKLWDLTAKTEIPGPSTDEGISYCLAYSPDGKTLATGGLEEIVLWDVSRGCEPKGRWPSGIVQSMRYSVDGRFLLTTDRMGAIQIWDVERQTVSAEFNVPSSWIVGMSFAPDGPGIAWATIDVGARSRLWKATPGKAIPPPQSLSGSNFFSFAVSLDGRRLVAGDRRGGIQTWDMASGKPGTSLDAGGWVTALAISADGRLLAHGRDNGALTVAELTTKRILLSRHEGPQSISALALSADGRLLASADSESMIKLWEIPEAPTTTATFRSQKTDP
jgi:WD40 repeat protein